MAGLNYGRTYSSKKGIRINRQIGIFYSDLSNKWVVRVKHKGQCKTLAQYKTEEEAKYRLKEWEQNSL
jgi:hypothetical protein